jgi:hypothetical protein
VSGARFAEPRSPLQIDPLMKKNLLNEYEITIRVPETPRKKNQPKPKPVSPEEHFKAISDGYLQQTLENFNKYFAPTSAVPGLLMMLTPKQVFASQSVPDFKTVLNMYRDDIKTVTNFGAEYLEWKKYLTETDAAHNWRGKSLAQVVQQMDRKRVPRIFVLLQILATLPVTTATGKTSREQFVIVTAHSLLRRKKFLKNALDQKPSAYNKWRLPKQRLEPHRCSQTACSQSASSRSIVSARKRCRLRDFERRQPRTGHNGTSIQANKPG